ncbi:MAG: type II toxin-antitoxin system HicA family toxin [Thermodesulfobacteriota bacterium]|nr:type II toxin-antitoxin system HicA family toxin [Thermodesulfobacteriota bacterium]
MKRRDLEKTLKKMGWWFLRHGRRHDVWTDGDRHEPIPRHIEINEKLARAILRKAKKRENL